MQLFKQGEVLDIIPIILSFLGLIYGISNKDEHYNYRIKIPKRLHIMFFNAVKDGSVPLMGFVTAVQFYISLPVFAVIKVINHNINLGYIMVRYLYLPWFGITAVIFILEIIEHLNKRRRQKQELGRNKKIRQDAEFIYNKKHRKRK